MDSYVKVTPVLDGGNPRNGYDIIRRADDFYIFPFSEDGDQNYHFHMNVQIDNASGETVPVRFTVNWGDEEYQKGREYLLICENDHRWNYIDVDINGTETTGIGDAPPGVSYLALHPRYAHERFIRLIGGLGGKYCVKTIGTTRKRRDITALEIGNKHRRPVIFYGRVHPYETIASYMMEGMVKWLDEQNEEVDGILNDNYIIFVPMPNPDGVADGTNKLTHGGLDFSGNFAVSSEPEAEALKKYFTDIKPGIIFDVHGWNNTCDNIQSNDATLGRFVYKTILDEERLFFRPVEMNYRSALRGAPNHSCLYFAKTLGCSFFNSSWNHVGRTAGDMYEMGVALLKAITASCKINT